MPKVLSARERKLRQEQAAATNQREKRAGKCGRFVLEGKEIRSGAGLHADEKLRRKSTHLFFCHAHGPRRAVVLTDAHTVPPTARPTTAMGHLSVWGAPYHAVAMRRPLSEPLSITAADPLASVALHELDWRWRRAAYASPLRIVVLGGSVTGGCGLGATCTAAGRAGTCLIDNSWGHVLSDILQQSLGGVDVQVSLFGKSAVEPSYFVQCPSRFGLRNADVVLLELENGAVVVGGRGLASIAELVAGVRRAAPESAVAFVGWPPSPPRDGLAAEQTVPPAWAETFEKELLSETRAPSLHLDVLLMRALLRWLHERNYSTSEGDGGFHADKAHPNCAGHALMGRAAAALIETRLRRAGGAARPSAHNGTSAPSGSGEAGVAIARPSLRSSSRYSGGVRGAESEQEAPHLLDAAAGARFAQRTGTSRPDEPYDEPSAGVPRPPTDALLVEGEEVKRSSWRAREALGGQETLLEGEEVCYSGAAEMPVANGLASYGEGGTWRLVNDGSHTSAGLAKVGYESRLRVWDPRDSTVMGSVGAGQRRNTTSIGARGIETIADVMTLGPIAPQVACALLEVSLGYMQSWRPESGRFSLACGHGCACYELAGASAQFRRSNIAPFPDVETWQPNLHATISSSTSFLLHKRAGECYLNVTHHPRPPPAHGTAPRHNWSHVRIDRLGFRVASCTQHCLLAKKGTPTRAVGVQVRVECVDGWRARKPGHVGASCFANSSSCLHLSPATS